MASSSITAPSIRNVAKIQDRQSASLDQPSGSERRHSCDDNWTSVQGAVVGLFQKKKLGEKHLFNLQQNVRNLRDLNGSNFMFDFHVKQVLTRGTVILREKIRAFEGLELLTALTEAWDYFYGDIVPTMQAIFFPVKPKYATIRQASFIAFRDVVVLKVPLKEALDETIDSSNVIPAGITQMLLVLLSVRGADYSNENLLALEKLASKVVVPYLNIVSVGASTSIAQRKTMSGNWLKVAGSGGGEAPRLTRPMSAQNFRLLVTVEDMYRSAYSKPMCDQ